MATASQSLLDRFSNLSGQPVVKQLRLLLGLAGSIALALGMVQWAVTPDFTPLYGELSPGSSAEVIQALEANSIRYSLDNRTGLISVPSDQVRKTRLKLAGEGLPKGQSKGFDVLNQEPGMGVSSFMEKARFDRALEQELSSSIASLDSVKAARVHLALPEKSAFVRKRNQPAASVLVSLYPGRELSDNQLAGIVHLIAFSVPGLAAEKVSVVDNKGKLLSSQNSTDHFAGTKENFRYTRLLEKSYVDRITEILSPFLGVGSVQAQVTADVDFTAEERTSERYEPQTSIRSEQLTEELTADRGAIGIPGTLSNQPPEKAEVGDQREGEKQSQAPPSRSSKREIRNYEVDKTISHVRETPGTLKKLSVAVVVDYREKINEAGVAERLPLTENEMAEVTALVREAVGFDAVRGDTVNVLNTSFVTPPVLEPMPAVSLLEQEWVWRSGKLALVGISIFLIIFLVLRPLMQASTVPVASIQALGGPGEMPPGTYAAQDMAAMGDDRVTLGQHQTMGLPAAPAYQQQLNMARTMVAGEPERVASVVKGWVANDG